MTDNLVADAAAPRQRNPLLRLLASVWFGVITLFLILVYACVASALPQVRGAVEMTEMEIFGHWVFALLNVVFCVSLAVSTLTRIRWNMINAGVLTVHTGMLLLAGGSFWYFQSKVEGDVVLRSPRIEIRTADGRAMRDGKLLAAKGQSWTRNMPTFGGHVHVEVLDVSASPVKTARVSVKLGGAPPEIVDLSADGRSAVTVGDRLQVALKAFSPEQKFYEDATATLYFRKLGLANEAWKASQIVGLPHHRERYLDEGYVLHDSTGKDYPSLRVSPVARLGGIEIPTGWFEHWRLPIKLDAPDLPFDVAVTGYLPYIARMEGTVRPIASGGNPVVELGLWRGDESMRSWLLADDPVSSLLSTAVPFEFYWVKSAAEREKLLRPLAGPHELTIELTDPPLSKTLSITQGQTIELEGTPYKLTIKQLAPTWPLMTAGFEGARSPMASVDVTNGEKSYSRTVIQRFPQLSQDVDEQGVRHSDGPYDANLKLLYRTSATGWAIITAGPGVEPVVGVFDNKGGLKTYPAPIGREQPVKIRGFDVNLTLHTLYEHGSIAAEPVIEPLATRRPNLGRQLSAIRLKLNGRGEHADWSDSEWIMYSSYPHVDAKPIRVTGPGETGEWDLIFSRRECDLGADLYAGSLSVEFFPGRRGVESWRSDFYAREDGESTPRAESVMTNHTATVGRWTYFQSGAAPDHWSHTILGVGNRNGIWPMTLGCIMITFGCMYAFYIKPVLMRRRAARSRSTFAARSGQALDLGKGRSESQELVEAR